MSLSKDEMKDFRKKYTVNPKISVLETEAMKRFKPAPVLRPAFNIGGPYDIPNGRVVKGARGENIILGGWHHVNSVTGGGNTFKSEQILSQFAAVLGRYLSARGIYYDTENTMTYERICRALHKYAHTEFYDPEMDSLLPGDERKVTFLQAADMSGDEWIEATRDLSRERTKNKRSARPKNMVTMPIKDPAGNLMQMMAPLISICDSLSMFTTASVMEKTLEKNSIGDGANQTFFMKDGLAKTQMFFQIPGMTTNGDIFMGMVAHIGTQIQIDPYAPKPLRLTFQKAGTALKGVPEKFSFINNNVYETWHAGKLINPKDKAPFYPSTAADKNSGNDMMQITAFSTRNKSGPTGVEYNLVASQKEGIDYDLTTFHLNKAFGKPGWGMDGNDQNYFMMGYEECKLSRTTVRNKLHADAKLKRINEIYANILQIQLLWNIPDKWRLDINEILDAIKARGYSLDQIFNTRGHWVFAEDEHMEEMPFLSAADILAMSTGDYHPFWIEEIPSKNQDKEKLQKEHDKNWKVHMQMSKQFGYDYALPEAA